jgi:hypothetical protein
MNDNNLTDVIATNARPEYQNYATYQCDNLPQSTFLTSTVKIEQRDLSWNDVRKGDIWLITFYDGPYEANMDIDIVKIKIKAIGTKVIGYKFHWWERTRWCRKDRVSLIERYKAAT